MRKILIGLLLVSALFLTGANVRWKDKADIVTLAATQTMTRKRSKVTNIILVSTGYDGSQMGVQLRRHRLAARWGFQPQ